MVVLNRSFLIDCVTRVPIVKKLMKLKRLLAIGASNDSLDDNEEVYSNKSKEWFKDIESHPAYLIL